MSLASRLLRAKWILLVEHIARWFAPSVRWGRSRLSETTRARLSARKSAQGCVIDAGTKGVLVSLGGRRSFNSYKFLTSFPTALTLAHSSHTALHAALRHARCARGFALAVLMLTTLLKYLLGSLTSLRYLLKCPLTREAFPEQP